MSNNIFEGAGRHSYRVFTEAQSVGGTPLEYCQVIVDRDKLTTGYCHPHTAGQIDIYAVEMFVFPTSAFQGDVHMGWILSQTTSDGVIGITHSAHITGKNKDKSSMQFGENLFPYTLVCSCSSLITHTSTVFRPGAAITNFAGNSTAPAVGDYVVYVHADSGDTDYGVGIYYNSR